MIETVSSLAALLCILSFILFGRKTSGHSTPRKHNSRMRRHDGRRRRRRPTPVETIGGRRRK